MLPTTPDSSPNDHNSPFQQWLCTVCGWVYDEAAGAPDHGLPPGTRLHDIPDDWYCPECGVTKADFTVLDF